MPNIDRSTCTERRYDFFSFHKLFYSNLFVLFFMLTIISNCYAHSVECDFNGSGLDLAEKGIQPVYLSCSSGRVEWRHPRSALRIVLQLPGEKRDFRGCIRVSPEIEGARLFVEGHRSLVPLYSKGDGQPKERMRCFMSYNGLIALYLEADPSMSFKDLQASFEYDLQPLARGMLHRSLQECRPCTVTELVQFYCSADFVAKGFILLTKDDELLQQTKIVFQVTKIFQQITPIFSKDKAPLAFFRPPNITNNLHINFSEEVELNMLLERELINDNRLYGYLFMPIKCGARAGLGEFIVIGNMRLGQPVLHCAPRIQQWKEVVRNAQDRAHCVLES